jgi:hypothetical protein
MKTLLLRLAEPSTYAGLSGLALALGLTTDDFQGYAMGIAGVFSFVAVLLGEKSA